MDFLGCSLAALRQDKAGWIDDVMSSAGWQPRDSHSEACTVHVTVDNSLGLLGRTKSTNSRCSDHQSDLIPVLEIQGSHRSTSARVFSAFGGDIKHPPVGFRWPLALGAPIRVLKRSRCVDLRCYMAISSVRGTRVASGDNVPRYIARYVYV